MQVQKIQSTNVNFGTKVKMNPRFICGSLSVDSSYSELRKYINTLKNNGNDDVMHIFEKLEYNPKKRGRNKWVNRVYADVYKTEGNKLYMGKATVGAESYSIGKLGGYHMVNLIDLYNKAKENMCQSGVHINKWVDYI